MITTILRESIDVQEVIGLSDTMPFFARSD